MEMNNRIFIKLKQVFFVVALVEVILYYFLPHRYFLVISLIMLSLFYYVSKSFIIELYADIRNVIQSIHQKNDYMIQDGDLGLLYDEVKQLQNRTNAYEQTIEEEKKKLRKTIEDICHQLKTPITSISIYNELLKNDYQKEYVEESYQQIEKITYLLNSLLTLAKLESNQIEFDFQDLYIKNIIQLSLQSLHSLLQIHDINVEIEDCHIHLYCDESWIQEAISNILKNNIEHGCSKIHISFVKYNQYIKIVIHNNGEEINSKDLPHIFERFYHTQNQQGVGIGLSLSQEIIQRHHGSIEAYNQDGVVFEIMLPIYQVTHKYQLS